MMQTSHSNQDCSRWKNLLAEEWLEELDEATSSSLFSHLRRCPHCQQQWIALNTAGDLATRSYLARTLSTND